MGKLYVQNRLKISMDPKAELKAHISCVRTSSSCSHSSASDPALGQVHFWICSITISFSPVAPVAHVAPALRHPIISQLWLPSGCTSTLSFASRWNSPEAQAITFFFSKLQCCQLHFTFLLLCVQTLQLVWMGLSPLLMQSHTGRALNSKSAVSHLTLHFVISLNSCQPSPSQWRAPNAR